MIEDRLNDEIKEILDKLKETADYPKINYSSYDKSFNETIDNVAMIKSFACKQLLDYITNLQQENEKLKNRIEEITKIYQNESKYRTDLETKYVQLQKAVEEAISLLWESDITFSKGIRIINILNDSLISDDI